MRSTPVTDLVILMLAAYRMSLLLVREYGPADIFVKMRLKMGVRFDEQNREVSDGSFLGSLITCVWCTSMWVGMGLAGLYVVSRGIGRIIMLPFALSGFVVLADKD